ncbi:TetR family transcriptional regulator [Micromonospora sp. NPDC049523]|uniref:TetR/AcrR family transcriptional regulator n=1 Tax=Micromonospora sp. NPDC049523 TaxID=3155921 RepID=UPI0034255640
MTAQPPGRATRKVAATATDPTPRRRRDATETRQLLLDAARRRFASDGYAATTVRDIADDAGVNVALISRYFTSKEGLFEACLGAAGDELRRTTGEVPFERVPEAIAHQVAGFATTGVPGQLTLLLRSSGDTRADEIRLGVLHQSGERLAAAAGWRPDEPDGDRLLLQAQIVLAATIGLAVLRTSTPLQPLASATEQDLVAPLRALIDALLPPP